MWSVVVSLLHSLRFVVHSRIPLHLEVVALRHQLAVVNRSRRPRLRFTIVDRLLWAWLSQRWPGWRAALHVVQPATVLAWHGRGFVCSARGGANTAQFPAVNARRLLLISAASLRQRPVAGNLSWTCPPIGWALGCVGRLEAKLLRRCCSFRRNEALQLLEPVLHHNELWRRARS